MEDDTLTPEALLHNLPVAGLPRHVLCYQQIDSTMTIARQSVREQPAERLPLLVLADAQTAGRGRQGRPWAAPAGSALLFSLALRPDWLPPAQAMALVWMAGVSLCEAITTVSPLQARLKWPNDVLVDVVPNPLSPEGVVSQRALPHKLAGILMETSGSSERIEWAIIGCGINIYASPPASIALRYPATHINAIVERPVSRLELMRALLQRLDGWHERLQAGQIDELFQTWRALLATLGQPVRIETEQGMLSGLAEDVDPTGALHIRDATGQLHIVTNGDVSG